METDQHALWNGPAAEAWIEGQERLDRLLAPFGTLLVEEAARAGARQPLDIGCGTGATTLALARRLGAACGVDISAPMIERARARARAGQEDVPARFVVADAQEHPFQPAAFDRIVSRFGVMFFADPTAAFANLRRALRPGGGLDAIAWRGPDENPFMTAAERAAAGLIELPPRQPGGPGQFAFADRERVTAILAESGWNGIDIAPLDVTCAMPETELHAYVSRMGPVGQALGTAEPEARERVIEHLRTAFATFVEDGEARFVAACWRIRART